MRQFTAATDEELTEWARTAGEAGDPETMLIARIALGESPDLDAGWAVSPAVLARLRRYTPRSARRAADRWGPPYPDDEA